MPVNPKDKNWGPARLAIFADYFLELGIEEGLTRARKMGFWGFEMLVEDALKYEQRMTGAYEQGEFYISSLGVILNDFNLGKEPRQSILEKLYDAIRLSVALGHPGIILADFFPPPAPVGVPSREDRRGWLAELVCEAINEAEKNNVFFLIEAMVERDSSTFPTIESCVEFINRFDSPAIKLLYDTYHFQYDGVDPLKVLQDHTEILGHVHLSDSARGRKLFRPFPGGGDVDFESIVEFLDRVNPVPFWALEGDPITEDAMQRTANYISSLRKRALPVVE